MQPTEPLIRYRKKADTQTKRWWAMSATFHRSMRAQEQLEAFGLETFVPLRLSVRLVAGRKIKQWVPAVSNLIFVRATEAEVAAAKRRIGFLQFLCLREQGRLVRIIVPDEQMAHFKAVAGSQQEDLQYFTPEEINFAAGDRVRIHGGPFDGVEGVFVKVQGRRQRMVVVSIESVMSVATLTFQPELLQKL